MNAKGAITHLVKRPMGVVFTGMLIFGLFLMIGGDSGVPEILRIWPVYGVFIIPAIVGITMLLLTADEVSKIHGRFDSVESKLDKLDNIESKLDSIESILKEIAGYLKPK